MGGEKISRGWYNAVVKALKKQVNEEIAQVTSIGGPSAQAELSQLDQVLAATPANAFNEMIGNFVIEQKGPKAGLKVTPADENAFIKKTIKKEFNNLTSDFDQAAKDNKMTPAEFRQFLLMDGYNFNQLSNYVNARVPKTGTFVNVRHILIADTRPTHASYPKEAVFKAKWTAYEKSLPAAKAKAENVLHLLIQSGNSTAEWKKLATKYPGDPGSATKGGNLGWAQASSYVTPFKNASLKWHLDKDGIVMSQFGYHVMEVLRRKAGEDRLYKAAAGSRAGSQCLDHEPREGEGLCCPQIHPSSAEYFRGPIARPAYASAAQPAAASRGSRKRRGDIITWA